MEQKGRAEVVEKLRQEVEAERQQDKGRLSEKSPPKGRGRASDRRPTGDRAVASHRPDPLSRCQLRWPHLLLLKRAVGPHPKALGYKLLRRNSEWVRLLTVHREEEGEQVMLHLEAGTPRRGKNEYLDLCYLYQLGRK